MSSLRDVVATSLDYSLTWCVHGWQEPYEIDWNQDPSLIIVQLPDEKCRLEIRDGGIERVFDGKPGDAFILPAGTVHRFKSPGCFVSGVNIQYTLFSSIDVLQLYRVPIRAKGADAANIAHCIGRLVTAAGEIQVPGADRPDDQLDLMLVAEERKLAFKLLAMVLDFSEMRPTGHQRLMALQRLSAPLRFLEEHIEQKISIGKLAEIAQLSTHRFSIVFKDVIGVTPHQYVLRRRVDKAMKLLSSTDKPIGTIAAQLGFHDQPHFTREFKAQTGVSPSFYRKNLQRRFQQQLRIDEMDQNAGR